jgi:signal transduction histidine kinase
MRPQFKNMLAERAQHYGFAVILVAFALVFSWLLTPLLGELSPHMFLLAAVAISAWHGGLGAGAAATLLATLACVYLLPQTWPQNTAAVGTPLPLARLLAEGLLLSVLFGMLHARLRHAEDALRARDDWLAVAAHELKTPLTAVIGYTHTLQVRGAREGHLPRRDQDTLRVIAAQAKRLHRLIDSVLDLARLHNGQTQIAKQTLDLAALTRQAVADARLTAARHLVEFRDPHAPVMIVGDSVRLEQVLQNLLDNALKYSPADGVITVCVEQRNAKAVLTVSDQGIGIPEAARARLFERFYRASNLDPDCMRGTGIGLSIVGEIVALHGGVVEVDSTEGRGSTFSVRLPLLESKIAAQSAQADSRQPVPLAAPPQQLEQPVAKSYGQHSC